MVNPDEDDTIQASQVIEGSFTLQQNIRLAMQTEEVYHDDEIMDAIRPAQMTSNKKPGPAAITERSEEIKIENV